MVAWKKGGVASREHSPSHKMTNSTEYAYGIPIIMATRAVIFLTVNSAIFTSVRGCLPMTKVSI